MPITPVFKLVHLPTGEIIQSNTGDGIELTIDEIQFLITQETACIECNENRVIAYTEAIAEQESRKGLYEDNEGERVAIDAMILQFSKQRDVETEQKLQSQIKIAMYKNYV